jgi:flavin reductase (DIM6/NTAB) family NADH-FMN oxidoreductase RutF
MSVPLECPLERALPRDAVTFSDREFRDALGFFPTGVAVVTTMAADGSRVGATISSFNSVSMSPPLVLFSMARSAAGFAIWAQAQTYAVSVLAQDQAEISTRFARSRNDKWKDIEPTVGTTGSPLLPNALACFECESYARYDGGDHLILVGRVKAITVTRPAQSRPLVFYRGRYRELDREHPVDPPADLGYLLHGW